MKEPLVYKQISCIKFNSLDLPNEPDSWPVTPFHHHILDVTNVVKTSVPFEFSKALYTQTVLSFFYNTFSLTTSNNDGFKNKDCLQIESTEIHKPNDWESILLHGVLCTLPLIQSRYSL